MGKTFFQHVDFAKSCVCLMFRARFTLSSTDKYYCHYKDQAVEDSTVVKRLSQ